MNKIKICVTKKGELKFGFPEVPEAAWEFAKTYAYLVCSLEQNSARGLICSWGRTNINPHDVAKPNLPYRIYSVETKKVISEFTRNSYDSEWWLIEEKVPVDINFLNEYIPLKNSKNDNGRYVCLVKWPNKGIVESECES